MAKKKQNSNNYFTQETEDAIVEYNRSSDSVFRDRIFTSKIYFPLYKLAENIIHTFKFYYTDVNDIEDLKLEVISMLVEEKLHRFDPSVGAKAYSYFGTIVKRWLISYNAKNYKKLKQIGSFDDVEDSYETELDNTSSRVITLSDVVDIFTEEMYQGLAETFSKQQEQEVADAVLTLFKTRRDLGVFKKKALYIYVREMTDCETPVLTKVIGKLKEEFYNIHNRYQEAGILIQYS